MKSIISLILAALICNACQTTTQKTEKIIIISKENKRGLYGKWISKFDSNIVTKSAFHLPSDSLAFYLEKAVGIIISGGEDVNPKLYNKSEEIKKCEEIDNHRDSLEFALIKYAMNKNIPLFGICRGLQIINVANGGSLIIDIPTDLGFFDIHRKNNDSTIHKVYSLTKKTSLFYRNIDSGIVVSHHHQCIDRMADIFTSTLISNDSIIEAFECPDTNKYMFIAAVQFHPERINADNPISTKLAKEFIKAINKRIKYNEKNYNKNTN